MFYKLVAEFPELTCCIDQNAETGQYCLSLPTHFTCQGWPKEGHSWEHYGLTDQEAARFLTQPLPPDDLTALAALLKDCAERRQEMRLIETPFEPRGQAYHLCGRSEIPARLLNHPLGRPLIVWGEIHPPPWDSWENRVFGCRTDGCGYFVHYVNEVGFPSSSVFNDIRVEITNQEFAAAGNNPEKAMDISLAMQEQRKKEEETRRHFQELIRQSYQKK